MPEKNKVSKQKKPSFDDLNIKNAIHTIKPVAKVQDNNNEAYYNKYGIPHLKSEIKENEICAAKIKVGNSFTYKVKASRGGRLYNPSNESSNYSLNTKDRVTKENMFKFKITNEKAFNNYIRFLKTGYDSLLSGAEREMS